MTSESAQKLTASLTTLSERTKFAMSWKTCYCGSLIQLVQFLPYECYDGSLPVHPAFSFRVFLIILRISKKKKDSLSDNVFIELLCSFTMLSLPT